MKQPFYAHRSTRRLLIALLIIALLPISGLTSVRPAEAVYRNRFSITTQGAMTFTGNTLGLSKRAGANAPGTVDGIGAFTSTNQALRDATYPLGTTATWQQNGSSAVLAMPTGSTVLHAELIWSGSYSYGGEDVSAALDQSITFSTPTNPAIAVAPEAAPGTTLGTKGANGTCATDPDFNPPAKVEPCFYVRWADVTAQVRAAGAGTYSVGGVPATQSDTPGSGQETRNNAGWTLAVIYGDQTQPTRNLTLFVGNEVTNSSQQSDAVVQGFCTPQTGPLSGRLLLSASEGDANRVGDQMQFGRDVTTLVPMAGPNNPINNFFASQINQDTGTLNTTGSFGTQNQNALTGTNRAAGRQGWDITNLDVSARLQNAQIGAVARGTSTGDQYVINALGTQIDVGAPFFPPDVKRVDKVATFEGDTLTYNVRVENQGTATAQQVLFTDPPPAGTSFIPGTFTIGGIVQPGANPAAGVPLGDIPEGTTKLISFKVRVNSIPASFQFENRASWTYSYVSCQGQTPLNGSVTTNPAITRAASIAPVKSANPTGPVGPGQVVTYDVRVPNIGLAPTVGSTLVDPIPAGVTYLANSTTLNGVAVPDLPGGIMPFTQPRLINSPGAPAGQIDPGAAAVVQFRATVNSNVSAAIVNIATADEDGNGPIPPKEARAFNPVVNLRASKVDTLVADTAPPGGSPGDTIEYRINVNNTGTGTASGVTFTDAVPANTSYVPGSTTLNGAVVPDLPGGVMPFTQSRPINSPGALAGQIAPNATAAIAFRVVVANPLPRGVREIANQGTITSNEQPAIFTDDPSTPTAADPTITPVTAAPVLSADKSPALLVDADGNSVVSPGDTLGYTIVIRNTGNTEAAGVVYNDTPDANTTLVPGSVTTTQGTVTSGNAGTPPIGVDIGSIPAPDGTVTIRYRVQVVNPLPVGVTQLVNQGVVSSTDLPAVRTNDPRTPQPNDPTRVPVSAAPELTADKVARLLVDADNNNQPSPGDTLIYQITIRNSGNTAAINVVYTDTPDANTTLVPGTVQTNAGTVTGGNSGTPPVSVQIGTLAVDSTVTISYRTTINNPLPAGVTRLENQGLVTSSNHPPVHTNDPTTPRPDDPTVVIIKAQPELSATKTDILVRDADLSGAPSAGDTLLYQIVVRNTGNIAAANLTLADTPDLNTTLVAGSVQSNLGTVTRGNTAGDRSVAVALGDLPGAGGSATISFRVRINSPLPAGVSQVANQGVFNSSSGPAVLTDDPDTPAQDDPTITPLTPAPAIAAQKTDDLARDADGDGAPSPGDTLRYTIVVRNTGNGPATGVALNDTPDSNTTLVAGSVTTTLGTVTRGNTAGDRSVGVDIGGLPSGGSATVTFQVVVNDPLPETVNQVANQALISGNFPTVPSDDPATPAPDDPTITPLVRAPRLSASKVDILDTDADGNGVASPGDTLLYQITLRNTGSASATGVFFTDAPDVRAIISGTLTTTQTNVILVNGSVQSSQGTVEKGNTAGDQTISISIGTLPARTGIVTISFKVRIKNPVPANITEVSNQGVVSGNFPSLATDDPDTLPVGDPTITPIRLDPAISADKNVSLALDADNDGRVTPGDTLQYRVIITSRGNVPALALVYTDTPDPNTTLVPGSVSTSLGNVQNGNAGTPPVRVAIGDLPPGARVTISYRTIINNPLPAGVTRVENQGLVTGSNIPDTATNDPSTPAPNDPTRTPVTPTPTLSAEKSDYLTGDANNNGKPSAGDTLTYLVRITNKGQVAASNVVFNDNPTSFFPNVTFKAGSVVTSQGTVLKGNATGDTSIQITIGTLPPGASVHINFDVIIKNPVTPNFVKNQGTIAASNAPTTLTDDPDTPAPNDPTVTFIPPGQGPPTAIQLLSFTARWQGQQVAVHWATGAELDTWGFHVYRSTTRQRSSASRITPAILLAVGRNGGASYSWIDTPNSQATIYYYWLQEIELDGTIHEYGPIATSR